MKERRMFHEDLVTETPAGPMLIARKCTECGRIQFPQKGVCQGCLCEEAEDILVGNRAKLFSFTLTNGPVAKFEPPFTVGYLELPEGIRVFAPLKMEDGVEFEIGMEMELEIADLWEEEDAVITGYRYKAVKGGGRL